LTRGACILGKHVISSLYRRPSKGGDQIMNGDKGVAL